MIVVGAGIAGLTAAHRLKAAGLPVRVLEAADGPGGRMATRPVGGVPMDVGAQFLSTGYRVLPDLLRTAGLADQVVKVSGRSMVVSGARSWRFDTDRPLTFLTGGVLRLRDLAVPAARGLWATVRRLSRPTYDLGRWSDLGAEDGPHWTRTRFGPGVTDRLLAPALNGLCFQDLAGNSAMVPAALATFSARAVSSYTLHGGLGTLTAALAAELDVEYGVRVERIRRGAAGTVTDGGVRRGAAGTVTGRVTLTTSAGPRTAAAVVLATPAAPAVELLADPTPDESAVLATPYSSGLLVGLALTEPLADHELGGAYGVLAAPGTSARLAAPAPSAAPVTPVPPVAPAASAVPSPLAAIAVHSRADATATGELLTVFLTDAAARRMATADDATVRAAAVQAVTPLLPGLPDRITDSHVARWPQALPRVPLGHPAAVRRYRDHLPAASPVVLAGDYLGGPWSDAAAFNGRWAADRVIADRVKAARS